MPCSKITAASVFPVISTVHPLHILLCQRLQEHPGSTLLSWVFFCCCFFFFVIPSAQPSQFNSALLSYVPNQFFLFLASLSSQASSAVPQPSPGGEGPRRSPSPLAYYSLLTQAMALNPQAGRRTTSFTCWPLSLQFSS